MRILVYKWKAYNYKDVIAAFLALGCEVDEFSHHIDNYDEDEELFSILLNRMSETKYDFVFTVNYFGVVSDACQRAGVKYVSWTCDSPLITMFHQSVYNSVNRIFTFDLSNYAQFKAMGVENIYHLPLAVNYDRIKTLLDNTAEEKKELYKNDIAFVGSLYEINSYDRLSKNFSEYLKGYFDALMQAQLSVSGANIIGQMLTPDVLSELENYFKLEKTNRSFSSLELVFSTTVLGFKIAQLQRMSALIELSKTLDVSIYTNSDTKLLERVKYRGGVDYWSEMPLVFNQSKINLNFTIPNIETGIPLRCFDVLASGGFLMSNPQLELIRTFEEGKEIVCFDDNFDLVEKAKYYLEHENERRDIALRGMEKASKLNSYVDRIKVIFEKL